jgi:spore cortex formation protein SpoVR/YcgB (stage V sporulation)
MSEYRDETFILQFLTPKIARDLGLFAIRDTGANTNHLEVTETTRQYSFEALREKLAAQHRRDYFVPDLQAIRIDRQQNNRLVIQHNLVNDRPLDERSAVQVLSYLARLWQHDVVLRTWAKDDRNKQVAKTMAARGKYSI